ncbi:MAG: NHL repeat-containing protein, partial [Phycisphaerales bacterium]|nr:NHL repeat-containing protein [Phycisphaerales bacterium]
MLPRVRLGFAVAIPLAMLVGSPVAHAGPGDTTADAVLGQADFASGAANAGGAVTASSLNEPRGLCIDRVSGRLFVADSLNHRVLSWPNAAAFTTGQAADLVLGQPDLTSNSSNQGGATPGAQTLNAPKSVATDSAGRLYVADSLNIRILRYDPPFTTNMPAVAVFGQAGSFTTANQANIGAPNADNLGNPDGLAIDASDRLFVVDRFLSRVTIYSTPLTSSSADLVIGQPNLTTAGGNLTQSGLDHCSGAALDAADNLWVGDEFNNRAMLFLAPLANGKTADRVIGQPDFASNTANNGGIGAGTINYSGSSATVAVDPVSGNLYVSDALNNRVLEFANPLTNSVAARVFGQPDFTTATANTGGRSASTL